MAEEEAEDLVLIEAFAAGDEGAFETLYHRYRRQLYGFLYNLTGNPSLTDELFEETWLKVIDKLPGYRDEGRFSAWLFRIGRNLFIDRIRRDRKLRYSVELDSEDARELPGASRLEPHQPLDNEEIGKVISNAVGQLPEEQREVFLLRQQELSFKEIATIQQCSINTVLARMQYALKSLRKWIREVDQGGLIS